MILDLRNSDNRSEKLASFRTGHCERRTYKKKNWITWQSRGNELRHLPWYEALAIFNKEWSEVSGNNIKNQGNSNPWAYKNGRPHLTLEQKLYFAKLKEQTQ